MKYTAKFILLKAWIDLVVQGGIVYLLLIWIRNFFDQTSFYTFLFDILYAVRGLIELVSGFSLAVGIFYLLARPRVLAFLSSERFKKRLNPIQLLIVCILSWGFGYGISTLIRHVLESLDPNVTLILELAPLLLLPFLWIKFRESYEKSKAKMQRPDVEALKKQSNERRRKSDSELLKFVEDNRRAFQILSYAGYRIRILPKPLAQFCHGYYEFYEHLLTELAARIRVNQEDCDAAWLGLWDSFPSGLFARGALQEPIFMTLADGSEVKVVGEGYPIPGCKKRKITMPAKQVDGFVRLSVGVEGERKQVGEYQILNIPPTDNSKIVEVKIKIDSKKRIILSVKPPMTLVSRTYDAAELDLTKPCHQAEDQQKEAAQA